MATTADLRPGPLHGYLLLLRWHALRLRLVLPMIMIVQAGLAAGVVIGFGFLVPTVDDQTALYLSSGAATLGLVIVGLATAPQMVAQSKLEGTFDYTRAWPVGRLAYLLSDMTVWLLTALPGLAVALVVAGLRFDLDYSVSPMVVLAFLLTVVTSTALGYGIAYATQPALTSVIAQFVVFVTLMFSPVTFPAERLPAWLAGVHKVLPFDSMATIVRSSLAEPRTATWLNYVVVAVWAVLGFALTLRVMARRK
jgi:ABC-2 type transport system permease protein